MKCPSCGKENSDAAKFCKNCGERLAISSSQNDSKPEPVSSNSQIGSKPEPVSSNSQIGSKPEQKDNKNTLIICATAIICVIIIAGALVFMSGSGSDDATVNTVESAPSESSVSESDNSQDSSTVSKSSEDSMSYSEASGYLSGASSTVIQNTFDEADKNGDGVLTGSEISKFKNLADLTERTADTSNTENVEAQDYGAGDGTTKTRYCTTHGRVAVGDDNRCPYCEAEGLDSRTVKGSTEYI